MINSATIYPYHRPFLTPERHERVLAILLSGGGKGLKTMLGRVANRFGADHSLRYCPKCRREDLSSYGAPYWHRVHQLPDVTSCATHGVDLVPFIRPSESTYRERFQLVPLAFPSAARSTRKSARAQVGFARISAELLRLNLPVLGTDRWQAAYQQAASQRGFVDSNGRVQYRALAEALRSRYADFSGFQHQERILSTPRNPLGWLRTMFGRPDRSSHPICHLILIGYFWGSVGDFVTAVQDVQPLLRSEPAINMGVKQSEPAGTELLRDGSLSARAVAEKLGLSISTVVSRRRALGVHVAPRPKRLDEEFLGKLRAALRAGKQPRDIAAEFDISIATVYRVRRESAAVLAVSSRVQSDRLRRVYRSRWRNAIKSSRTLGVAAARRQDPAAYAWLYRKDRVWLASQNGRVRSLQRIRTARVDWPARDIQLCEKLKAIYISLRSILDRQRISKTALLRPLGQSSVVNNIARLPRLNSLIAELEESIEDFQKYRIDEAIRSFRLGGVKLSLWRIQRAAGIKGWTPVARMYALARIAEIEKQV